MSNKNFLEVYKNELSAELNSILAYWMENTCDNGNGGFIGRIDENNIAHADAPKGAVLHSRILWSFSEAYCITGNEKHLHIARIAYQYLLSNFIDKKYGGIYWTLTAEGKPLDTKKQVYALAFAIYGCSAFFKASGRQDALATAIELYRTIEKYSYDQIHTGYLEAFTQEWQLLNDLRLSNKDANEKKSMNTHLHVLEAYTSLYHIWPDAGLKQKIVLLIRNFSEHIVDAENHHLILFFDDCWHPKSSTVSYGHDIEAAWLLVDAAETIKELSLVQITKNLSLKIAEAAAQGLDKDGGLWYEYEPSGNHFVKEKHWWVQAEAMVGFFTCWQITGAPIYLERSLKSWKYVKGFIKDLQFGEWIWGRNEDGTIMSNQDKAGIWKCPYHNSRSCMEIIKRINNLSIFI